MDREQALKHKSPRYNMDKPCKRGHLGQRYTKSRVCCSCDLENQTERRLADPETNRQRVKDWQKANPKKHSIKSSKWYFQNREQHDIAVRDWQRRNPTKVRAIQAAYRARKLRATPSWADLEAIDMIYLECPKGHEVDHIVPLKGKYVSGLHVENNLQYLTERANRIESNSFEENWP